jgi:hypothetical protein
MDCVAKVKIPRRKEASRREGVMLGIPVTVVNQFCSLFEARQTWH